LKNNIDSDIMDNREFQFQVRKKLEKLKHEDRVKFAWVCAMRALPLLGTQGNFNYWKEKDRQKHLYAIFYSLDQAVKINSLEFYNYDDANVADAAEAVGTYASPLTTVAYATYAYAYAADTAYAYAIYARAAADVAYVAADAYTAAKDAAYAAYAAYAASDATDFNYDYDDYYDNYGHASYICYDTRPTINYATARTADTAANAFLPLKDILLQDIDDIYNNKKLNNDKSIYGDIWDKFQIALKDEGCEYWGRWYETIFQSGFQPDEDALDMRLSVPELIRSWGASAVADYLTELEKGAEKVE
jgi:hypothetical protein